VDRQRKLGKKLSIVKGVLYLTCGIMVLNGDGSSIKYVIPNFVRTLS